MVKASNNGVVRSQSAEEMLNDQTPLRELIEIGGKDSTGKTSALISMLRFLELSSSSMGHVIDSEKKFRSILKSFGADAPRNFVYYPVDNMNQATSALSQVLDQYSPGDWVMVESASRIWEYAQNLGYETIAGVSKPEYLDTAVGKTLPTGVQRKNSPIPTPDDFWPIVKGAHDAGFFNKLTEQQDLNVIFTTTVARPKQERGNQKESADRKALRVELGIDANLEGAPRLPYYPETLCLFDLERGAFSCRVLRDNLAISEEGRLTFSVHDKKSWGTWFQYSCRGSEEAKALLLGAGVLEEKEQ